MAACSTAGVRSVGLNSGIAMKDCYSQIKGGEKICSGDANCPFINGNDSGQGEERWLQSLRQFHNGRNLQMVHLSPSVTEKDIIDFFQQTGTLVKKVEINRRTHIARMKVDSSYEFDPLIRPWNFPRTLLGTDAKLKMGSSDSFLCVTNLPTQWAVKQFQELCEKFGPVVRCFLIYHHATDESLGFGLVEYCSRAVACQAKNLLHKKQVGQGEIHCDWLEHNLVNYADLYPRCLYVGNLPTTFCDIYAFRQLFTSVASPTYCQLSIVNGVPQGFGVVEFRLHEDARKTKELLHGHCLNGSRLNILFTSPGVSAYKLYNRIIEEQAKKLEKNNGIIQTPQLSPALLAQFSVVQNSKVAKTFQKAINLKGKGKNASQVSTTAASNHALIALQNFFNQQICTQQALVEANNEAINMSSESRDQQTPPGASCSWQSAWAGGQQSQEQSGQPIMQQGSSYDKQESEMSPSDRKRKVHQLMPSPEPSPEHGYIGQHAQALGGHYADSYFRYKKMKVGT
ncbi:ribonucleoprotein PTB-binding 1-like isoform X2 [Haemaphysalis longicornis]